MNEEKKLTNNLEDINERYRKAVEAALQKAPVRGENRIYLTDLWTITSLPEELLIETLSKNVFSLPEEVKAVVDDRRRKKKILYNAQKNQESQGGEK